MGRYYDGDISGKIWSLQDSDDAIFFGGEINPPSTISFYFTKKDLPKIKKGLAKCKKEMGENLPILNEYFKTDICYDFKELEHRLALNEDEVKHLLVWYSRYTLGLKILKCVKENGSCWFECDV